MAAVRASPSTMHDIVQQPILPIMEYAEEQKAMWEETNNIHNALIALGLDMKTLLRQLNVTPTNVSDDAKETIIRLGNSVKRISECTKNLQGMITKNDGE